MSEATTTLSLRERAFEAHRKSVADAAEAQRRIVEDRRQEALRLFQALLKRNLGIDLVADKLSATVDGIEFRLGGRYGDSLETAWTCPHCETEVCSLVHSLKGLGEALEHEFAHACPPPRPETPAETLEPQPVPPAPAPPTMAEQLVEIVREIVREELDARF